MEFEVTAELGALVVLGAVVTRHYGFIILKPPGIRSASLSIVTLVWSKVITFSLVLVFVLVPAALS